jgi:hypothetical protein
MVFMVLLPSCMVMRTSEKGYQPVRTVQNGTAFEAILIAEGSGSALAVSAMVVGGGAVSLKGPYRLQLVAYGLPGDHRTFHIRSVTLRTAKGWTTMLEPRHIAGSAVFARGEHAGEVVSRRTATKAFAWKPDVHGAISVEVDAEIVRGARTTREKLTFLFTPADTVKLESFFIPWEIKKSIWKETREHPITAWQQP